MISEDRIMQQLDMLLSTSEPGNSPNHLHVLSVPQSAFGPLGLPDEAQLKFDVYAIAAAGGEDTPEQFTGKVIMAAAIKCSQQGEVVVLAGMSQEMWHVESASWDEEAVRLQAEGRLDEHPDVVELTIVYGVCCDGRRWRGRRWLTGPKAGQTEDVELLVGQPRRGESRGIAVEALLRRLAGMAG
jgi:hypothetical protein